MTFRATINVTLAKELAAVDLDNAATITTTVTSVTVPGVKADSLYMIAFANADLDAGLVVQNPILCEVNGTLLVRVVNPTAGAINHTASAAVVIGL
jgi:hypothetical protein